MPRPRPPYLQKEKNRHGNLRWYFRKGKGLRVRVLGVFGSPEFDRNYQAALRGDAPNPVPVPVSSQGSLRWLWEQYLDSKDWASLKASTRRARLNIMRTVLANGGDEQYNGIDLVASRDSRTSSQGRNFLDAVRGMYRWGIKARIISEDPSADVPNPPRTETDGFPAWDKEDVEKFRERWPLGTKERVWLDVLLYTGARRGDAVRLGRQHVQTLPHPDTKAPTKVITFRTEKKRMNKEAVEVTIPILPKLQRTLDAGPCGDLAFIVGDRGRPLIKETFGNQFHAACLKAGIDKSAHGVRKIAAQTAAEDGATSHELMAIFGWLTIAMAERYTKKAAYRKMSMRSGHKLAGSY